MSVEDSQVQSRQLVKTKVPGVYARGGSFVVRFRDADGKQRQTACRTKAEAIVLQAQFAAQVDDGSYRAVTRETVAEYAASWLASYTGRTRHGIRAETVKGYASQMRLHVLPVIGRRRMTALGPRDIKQLAADLSAKGLAPNSVRLALAPLKAMLADAYEDEQIKTNPALKVWLAKPQETAEDGEARVKALTPEQVRRLLDELPPQWRLLVEFLAVTGLRIGEALALDWGHVDFGRRRVLVRRRWYRDGFAPPKSKNGRRDVPLTPAMTTRLWELRKTARGNDDAALIFGSAAGTPLNVANFYNRIYTPAKKRAGIEWATLHTLRHTCATSLFREGKNAKQVQAWLGHHAASFTLDTYIHLLDDDLGDAPDSFDLFAVEGSTEGSTRPTETGLNRPAVARAV
jgi:integrase